MTNSPGPDPLVIERILRDRDGIWKQIAEERDLRGLNLQMLTSSVVSFAIFGLVLGASNGLWQALSSMVKLPLLFLATLAICLPTLYLFNLVFGARLSMNQAVTLIMVSITVIAVLTLAFAPISLFFLITANSYAFFKLLNVGILVLTAVIGLRFLTAGMAALNQRHEVALLSHATPPPAPAGPPAAQPAAQPAESPAESPARELAGVGVGPGAVGADGNTAQSGGSAVPAVAAGPMAAGPVPAGPVPAGPVPAGYWPAPPAPAAFPGPVGAGVAPPRPGGRPTSMKLVYTWILLFGFVGTQLAWTLRPFFGEPNAPYALFREISGTFYADILQTIGRLFS
jgi:hypothetical protein